MMNMINQNGPKYRLPLVGADVLRIFCRNNMEKAIKRMFTWNARNLKITNKLVVLEKERKRLKLVLRLSKTANVAI